MARPDVINPTPIAETQLRIVVAKGLEPYKRTSVTVTSGGKLIR
jgi:hypothetical protein